MALISIWEFDTGQILDFAFGIGHIIHHRFHLNVICDLKEKEKNRLIEEKTKFFPLMIKYFLITEGMIKARFFL